MRKLSIIGAVALLAACAFGGGLELYTFPPATVATNEGSTVSIPLKVTGKPVEINVAVTSGSTSTVAIASTSGYGSSTAGAKTLLATYTNDAANLSTQLASTVYLYGDLITATVSNAWTNTVTWQINVLVNTDP